MASSSQTVRHYSSIRFSPAPTGWLHIWFTFWSHTCGLRLNGTGWASCLHGFSNTISAASDVKSQLTVSLPKHKVLEFWSAGFLKTKWVSHFENNNFPSSHVHSICHEQWEALPSRYTIYTIYSLRNQQEAMEMKYTVWHSQYVLQWTCHFRHYHCQSWIPCKKCS